MRGQLGRLAELGCVVGGEALHGLQHKGLVAEAACRVWVCLRPLVEEVDAARVIEVVSLILVAVVGVLP